MKPEDVGLVDPSFGAGWPPHIACGEGWKGLIREAVKSFPPGTTIAQIKEKFGGLRIYVDYDPATPRKLHDACEEAIRVAEEASLHTCEVCGGPGSLRGGSWVVTLCDRHWDQHQAERIFTPKK